MLQCLAGEKQLEGWNIGLSDKSLHDSCLNLESLSKKLRRRDNEAACLAQCTICWCLPIVIQPYGQQRGTIVLIADTLGSWYYDTMSELSVIFVDLGLEQWGALSNSRTGFVEVGRIESGIQAYLARDIFRLKIVNLHPLS